ncbi:hypothetical protein BH18ACT2_BH18ACT2_15410 [soil metagenome]
MRPADPNDPLVSQYAGTRDDWDDEQDDYTETKTFFRTSEFWFAVLGVVGVLLAAHIEGTDSMTRDDGWRYATFILIGYMVARGLAKAGTKEPDHH